MTQPGYPVLRVPPRLPVGLATIFAIIPIAPLKASNSPLAWNGSPDFRYHWLTLPLLRSIALDLLLLAICLILLLRLVSRMVTGLRLRLALGRQAGSSVMEFVLLTPLLLTVLLVIFQLALIVQAKIVVNYAAFCAVRSAIVVLPSYVTSTVTNITEDYDEIYLDNPDSPKMHTIRRAAAIACTGISPPMEFNPLLWAEIGILPNPTNAALMWSVAALFRGSIPGVSLDYANTMVKITLDDHPAEGGRFNATNYTLVTVRVTYRYFLTVPFAARLLGTAYWGGWFNKTFYIPINEQYILPSETDHDFPDSELPPNPDYITERYE